MLHSDALGLLFGAVLLGAVHGIEPGHGWPVAAAYALDQTNKWLAGLAASLLIGIGHLISSLAMVAVFFYAKSYFSLTQVNEPVAIDLFSTTIQVGGPVSIVAGVLLIALGVREYYGGHSHGAGDGHEDHGNDVQQADGHDHSHGHDDHDHSHDDHTASNDDVLARVKGALPFVGGRSHDHTHGELDDAAEHGLVGIAWFAFVLGFAHEEEFEIIALCAGSTHCLELMSAYALTVVAGIVGLTLLLIAGYQSYEERVEQYTPYLPVFSAVVLVVMGVGFVTGVL
jgi:ABC-type nickel/cobalt efflux system permease component RcnA